MPFTITGLAPDAFTPLFSLDDKTLAAREIVRTTANAKPGFPCRVTLEDAEPGEDLLLLNYESHSAGTPYRSSYAIYVRKNAREAARYHDEIPPVMRGRPLALRLFDETGMLVGADLSLDGDPTSKIQTALAREDVAYIDVHNAAHGCFAARVNRS
ncbi:DUF1203 domain-containing protein [Maricaulis maris]|uniref:Uncharacterized protein DUF1203 n=1 Tax=Maricaulis maris TaxID=74318 RepID=A0A495DK45_9PROT|nr:DUF1203 domain-containing protein [Maricaulis maris]RKR02985.1 uncharacterized protein DUF1203 [Maricaulis maris]